MLHAWDYFYELHSIDTDIYNAYIHPYKVDKVTIDVYVLLSMDNIVCH